MQTMRAQAFQDVIEGVSTRLYASDDNVNAPTLVMVHGGDPRSLSNGTDFSTLWDHAGALPMRLLTYDKPGQGFSFAADDLSLGMSVDQVTEHLRAVLDRYATGPVILLGHSRGALPVLRVVLQTPDRVSAVVTVSSNTSPRRWT